MDSEIIHLLERYPELKCIHRQIEEGFNTLKDCYETGGKLLVAGNGGSAADADHIVGELMKGFKLKREIEQEDKLRISNVRKQFRISKEIEKGLQKALPSISLCNHVSLSTAYNNDVDSELAFAQQLYGYGKEGDVFLAISTSGNSKNILYAASVAKVLGIKIIGLTGNDGGRLREIADVVVNVPERETFKIQERHLPIYHCWCLMLERYFFADNI